MAPVSLTAADWPLVLPLLLAAPRGPRAGRAQVEAFTAYAAAGSFGWVGLVDGPVHAPHAAFFALLLPGRTAMALVPNPGEHGIVAEEQRALTAHGIARLRERDLHYAQALLEPEAEAKAATLARCGFRELAPLAYLERDVLYPWVEPPARAGLTWRAYDATAHSAFAMTILATYRDSQDCPELTGLRPIDDVLAAHQASGRHDPQLWELALVDGTAAACLLLSRHTQDTLVEVVYMGVVPEFRRQGIGRLLLARALEQCRRVGARQLTVVVDERNAAAQVLYADYALQRVARRSAWIYRWM
jgi:mycothiol synthase